MSKAQPMLKLKILFLALMIAFVAIIAKLFYVQVLASARYASDYLSVTRLTPSRGRIFDRNGEPLVVNQPSYLVYAEPKKIEHPFEVIGKIDPILQIGSSTLEARLNPEKVWVALKKNIPEVQYASLAALKVPGIGFEKSQMRYYPESSLSAHLVGFVGRNDEDDEVGYFGIEGYYDRELGGLSGVIRSEQDIAGRPIFVGFQERVNPEDGRDLYLTLDKTVQLTIKNKLISALKKYDASEGCVIVADPSSMEILGLSCLPDFDPSTYAQFSNELFKNPAISNTYEPGSIFKPLIVAAALEERAVNPNELFDEDGPVQIGGYTIRTWNDEYAGTISLTQILERSSNVGMVQIGEKMGNDKIYEYVSRLGFGALTDIDLQGEVRSVLKPRSSWYPIDYATITFGQGIAVTPIQMLRSFAAVVNGGYLYRPYVVLRTGGEQKEYHREPVVVDRVFSERTSEIVKKMLVSTVENGEAQWAKPKGYVIGGKTGTAQVAIEGHYDASKTIASYIGFAPADDPQFIALVVLREPKSSPWASETAAPLFFDIARELLSYYNIPPSRSP